MRGAKYEEDGSRNNEGKRDVLQPPVGPAVVQWERILPFQTLKVLLVENDDSTRQVVSALLRNCSYEVTATANGLQAWKVLESPTNHVDLVLTEVDMPVLSGIGLLSKIMSHETCKNVPVIMMSSNDSMGTVVRCLSKGAADFLVKPIRKNELKNLWQHVWRRSRSSSGSVSESGIQTQRSPESKDGDHTDNGTDSDDEADNESIGLNARDGSDYGSGTQSSWTKHAVEDENSQPTSPSNQLAYPHDSTCALIISESKIFNKYAPSTTNRECQEQNEFADKFMGKDLEIGVPSNPSAPHGSFPTEKVSRKLPDRSIDKLPESNQKNENVNEPQSTNALAPNSKVADLIGGIDSNAEVQIVESIAEARKGFSRISESDKNNNCPKELPSLQLSLKRLRSTGDNENVAHDDHNVLRYSDQSAFSRYRTSAASTQAPTGYGGSCSPQDNGSDVVKTESTNNLLSNANVVPLKQGSNGSNNNDMGSTTQNAFSNPAMHKEKTPATLKEKAPAMYKEKTPAKYKEKTTSTFASAQYIYPSSAFHPVQPRTLTSQQVTQENIDNVKVSTLSVQTKGAHGQLQVEHHHHHYHHHHHHMHSMQQQQQQQMQPLPEHDDEQSHENMTGTLQQCDLTNMYAVPIEGNAANYSLNGSNSGSNHGSNEQNRSSAAVNTGGMNIETDVIAEKCGVEGGSGSGSGNGSRVDQSRFAQREAALNKFREKRKERNFGKKVRYQSRKRLAEQRPRVRGQFVKQNVQEYTSGEAGN